MIFGGNEWQVGFRKFLLEINLTEGESNEMSVQTLAIRS